MTKELNDGNFETTILNSTLPVLVDFSAEWCGPCKMLTPVVEELANELIDKALIVKLDVDKNKETAAKYGIMSIPTLLLFKNGEIVEKMKGFVAKATLKNELEKHL